MVVAETEARAGFEHPAVVAVEGIVEAVPVVAGGRGHGGIFEEVVVVGLLAVVVEGVAADKLEFEAVVVQGLKVRPRRREWPSPRACVRVRLRA